ncbi:MAG: DUF3943 domain-containing protein [Bacteriovoracaceae bacterium]|nr:DUF3943 domain-containing protein [Bacteriovoracaceae bacterium]
MLKVKALLLISFYTPLSWSAFEYHERKHTYTETAYRQGQVFVFHSVGYIATQFDTIKKDGSWSGYKDRFLDFQYDPDNSAWNLLGHPLTGAQVFLFYRAHGYTEEKAFLMGALSSLYFEVLIESYTERPSAQDTLNTPIFGAMLGAGIERVSKVLINSDSKFKNVLGRIINPFSFLVDSDDHKLLVGPNSNGSPQLIWVWNYD